MHAPTRLSTTAPCAAATAAASASAAAPAPSAPRESGRRALSPEARAWWRAGSAPGWG